MNQKEDNESQIENKSIKDETDSNLTNTDNNGCLYSVLFWLGLGLIATFIGSLSSNVKSLLGYLVFVIIVFAFLFWNGKDEALDRAKSGALVIFLLFVLGSFISQCSPSRHDPYDDYFKGVRR